MKNRLILDCTLRDGAYLIDKKFGDENIFGIIHGLMEANIDIIEIGFLQNDGRGKGKTVYLNGADAKKYIPSEKEGKLFTVLADYSRYSIDNLDENDGNTFDAVRACFFKHERFDAIPFCNKIKEKGYKVFVQPVDILGYSDAELIEFIEMINEVEPFCFSIVDTFGSMYQEDLRRVYNLIEHNLVGSAAIGFHSHNNLQMSSALSQTFLTLIGNRRRGIVDATISGMGRGAGNTPTELVAEYMVKQLGANYDMDAILDVINEYMDNIRSKCNWGYSTDFFVAGCYGAHVNNIAYLQKKNSISAKDIRYILNKLSVDERKRYDYDLLEDIYMEYLKSDIDDSETVQNLKEELQGENVVLLAPGKSSISSIDKIKKYIEEKNAKVISVNYLSNEIRSDYIYISNKKRFDFWKNNLQIKEVKKIYGSNIKQQSSEDEYIVSILRVLKCGWVHFENSGIQLLRLLDDLNVNSVGIAGLDGYDPIGKSANYAKENLETRGAYDNPIELNKDILSMLIDFKENRKNKGTEIQFITESRFEEVFA